jgi:uncharacterized SAM-binding protein YcdF (DUF218 family)
MREILSYSWALPPTIFIVTCLIGALISFVRPRLGRLIFLPSSVFLYAFATPAASKILLWQLESSVSTKINLYPAQAIVIPSADVWISNNNAVPDAVGPMTLDRLANAALLYRHLHLPIVVSGGGAPGTQVTIAHLMQDELEQVFLVPVTYLEEKAQTTYENAFYTSNILKEHNINSVYIVTQERDAPRMLWSFKQFGINVAVYSSQRISHTIRPQDFLPSATAFLETYYAFHELIGLIYYKMFYQNVHQ